MELSTILGKKCSDVNNKIATDVSQEILNVGKITSTDRPNLCAGDGHVNSALWDSRPKLKASKGENVGER
jgi:hypothetical protein